MNAKKLRVVVSLTYALTCVFGTQKQARAQSSKTLYPKMAPVEQYLMDRDAEISLARSGAPDSISSDATVIVLVRHGYETAIEGKNGFVCVVERAWMKLFDDPEFWNPKMRGASCYNPPAARSVLPILYMRTKLVLAGVPNAQMFDRIKEAYAKKELPTLEPAAMSFMMAKQSYLTDEGSHNMAHLMFFTSLMDGANWGADLPKSPVYLLPQFKGKPEPINVYMVLTGMWSDRTPARVM